MTSDPQGLYVVLLSLTSVPASRFPLLWLLRWQCVDI